MTNTRTTFFKFPSFRITARVTILITKSNCLQHIPKSEHSILCLMTCVKLVSNLEKIMMKVATSLPSSLYRILRVKVSN